MAIGVFVSRPALSDGKRGGLGDTSMYQTWRSSLLELQPYLDMRDKMQRNRLKKGQKEKSEEKKDDEVVYKRYYMHRIPLKLPSMHLFPPHFATTTVW